MRVRPDKDLFASRGFSLIELVVVIAILSVLISISLPVFTNIRRDAYIAQAKNILASIIKECKVAQVRGKSTLISDIPSARASLSGYRLSTMGAFGNSMLSRDCFAPNVTSPGPAPTLTGPAITFAATPLNGAGVVDTSLSPVFYITYFENQGVILKNCQISSNTVYREGCTATFQPGTPQLDGSISYPAGNGWGVW